MIPGVLERITNLVKHSIRPFVQLQQHASEDSTAASSAQQLYLLETRYQGTLTAFRPVRGQQFAGKLSLQPIQWGNVAGLQLNECRSDTLLQSSCVLILPAENDVLNITFIKTEGS
jgi:hypothetical protein